MWNLIRRAINRWLATLFIVIALWFGRRYAAPCFFVAIIFGAALYVRQFLPPWLLQVLFPFSLFIPVAIAVFAVYVFAWALCARAIEPTKPSGTLNWSPAEMAELPSAVDDVQENEAEIFEIYPEREDQPA